MRLDHASDMMAADLAAPDVRPPDLPGADAASAGDDQGLKAARRLRLLDFCAGALATATGLMVIVNALVLQVPARGKLPGAQPAMTTAGEEAAAMLGLPAAAPKVRSTSIPLPPAHPTIPTATGGETNGTLGYLTSKTSVTGMTTALVPVKPSDAAAAALTTPGRLSGQRPPVNVGPTSEVTGAIRPPVDLPASPRTLAVQRALARLGYGPLKVDGVDGAQTRQAIQRFQRDRRLPVDGEMSPRLVRELAAVSGMKLP